jgi:hypothetical protein
VNGGALRVGRARAPRLSPNGDGHIESSDAVPPNGRWKSLFSMLFGLDQELYFRAREQVKQTAGLGETSAVMAMKSLE